MRVNKVLARILTIVIFLTMLSSSIVMAEGKISKEETVYINLNNKGGELEKISSIWLHSETPLNTVKDKSILKEVVNVKGDEVPAIEDGKLIWETDKKDIYYQGKVDKELPIQPEIKYYLDGKEVNAEDIVGESGDIKITINIKNKDKRKEVYAPYIVVTAIDLPMNKFASVKTDTGKILSDGSSQIITFLSLPGLEDSLGLKDNIIDLPSYLEIEAEVKDFEMKPIVFTVTSEIPEIDGLNDAKNLDELIDGIDKIKEASERLSEATQRVYEGQSELNNGIGELVNGVGQFKLGSLSLLDGSLRLKEGLNKTYEGSLKINEGASTLSQGANELGEGFSRLGNGTVEFSNKAAEFSQGAEKVAEGIGNIPESTKELGTGMEELIQGTEDLKEGQDNLSQGLGKSLEALEKIKKGKERETHVVDLLLKGMEGLEKIAKGIEKLPGGESLSQTMKETLDEQKMALEGIKNSGDELIFALTQIEEGLKEAEGASKELAKGIENVNEGQRKIGGGLDELALGTGQLKDVSNQLVEGSNGLKQGAKNLNENAIGARYGVDKFVEGSTGLARGTNELTSGIGELSIGADKLYGGINELSKGTDELARGGEKLKGGSSQLTEGTKELNEGMQEFYQEGINKMSDELKGSDLDITNIIENKDELVKISKSNNSFTGISEDMDGSLKFIMKTQGVKGEEKQDKLDIKEEVETERGFVSWLKGIFRR